MKKQNKTSKYIDTLELESIYITERSASTNTDERSIAPYSQKEDTKKENEKKKNSKHEIELEIKQLLRC